MTDPALTTILRTQLDGMSVSRLRGLCEENKLNRHGTKAELVARLQAAIEAEQQWEALKANPPTYPTGYRIVLDGGAVVPITLTPCFREGPGHRALMVRATYTIPAPFNNPEYEEFATHLELEAVLFNVRQNIGANYPVQEFLRPGQPTWAELAAEVKKLRGDIDRLTTAARAILATTESVDPPDAVDEANADLLERLRESHP